MKPVAAHLTLKQERSPFMHLVHTVTEPRYRLAFILTMLLPTGGYMLMPFGTAYIVDNIGLSLRRPAHHLSDHRALHRLRRARWWARPATASASSTPSASAPCSPWSWWRSGPIWARAAGHGDRGQCAAVHRHLLAHDPVPGADLRHSRTSPSAAPSMPSTPRCSSSPAAVSSAIAGAVIVAGRRTARCSTSTGWAIS